jgi:hypothetical protein
MLYRTAFISFNADSSQNTATIAQNAATFKTLYPQILSHYNVDSPHRGPEAGSTSSTRCWDPAIAEIKAVFTDPNWARRLPEAYTDPWEPISRQLGLQNDGPTISVPATCRTSALNWTRSYAAGIPFFALAGRLHRWRPI